MRHPLVQARIRFRFHIEQCVDGATAKAAAGGSAACFEDRLVALDWYGRDAPADTLWPGDRLQLNLRLAPARQPESAGLRCRTLGTAKRYCRPRLRAPAGQGIGTRSTATCACRGALSKTRVLVERWRMAARRAMAQALDRASPAARAR
ncbi:MAG: hypothetical protein R3E68_16780 [Burkholderiaceae bacterium]